MGRLGWAAPARGSVCECQGGEGSGREGWGLTAPLSSARGLGRSSGVSAAGLGRPPQPLDKAHSTVREATPFQLNKTSRAPRAAPPGRWSTAQPPWRPREDPDSGALPRGATRSRGHADPEVPGRRSGPREALDAAVTAPPRSEQLSGLSPPHAVPRDLPTSESLAPALQRACVWNKVRSQSLRLPWVGEGRGRGCDFLALPSPTPVLPSLRPAGARHREGAWERAWGRKGGGWGRGLHPATWEPLSPGSLTPSFLGKSSTLHTEG